MVKLLKIYACTGAGSSVLCICKKWSKNQDKPRNYIQELWYTHIMYCTCGRNVNKPSAPTEVEEKGLQLWCDITVQQKSKLSSLSKYLWFLTFWSIWKYNSNIFFFHPLVLFPEKMMRCPWILCFDLLPLQYTDLTHEIWRFLVYISLCVQRQLCI